MTESRDWVVLIRGNHGYKQMGPFDKQVVNEKIQAGEFRYSDHVWRPGFNRWERVGDLVEFGAAPPEPPAPDLEDPFPDDFDVDLSNVVQQVRPTPDFRLLPPREEPPMKFEMIKGLGIEEKRGVPIDFIETPLVATRRLQYKIRVPQFDRRMALGAAALAGFLTLGLTVRSMIMKWPGPAPKFVVLPLAPKAKTAVPSTQAATQTAQNALAEPAAPMVAPVKVETPTEAPAGLATLPVTPAEIQSPTADTKAALLDLAGELALRFDMLEESYKSLRPDPKAWPLYYADWMNSVERGALSRLSDPAFAHQFEYDSAIRLTELQNLYRRLLDRGEQLDRTEEAVPTYLKSDIKSYVESLKQ